jgi:hypothetical protein
MHHAAGAQLSLGRDATVVEELLDRPNTGRGFDPEGPARRAAGGLDGSATGRAEAEAP